MKQRINHIIKTEKDYSSAIFGFVFMNGLMGLCFFVFSYISYFLMLNLLFLDKDFSLIVSVSTFYIALFFMNIISYKNGY